METLSIQDPQCPKILLPFLSTLLFSLGLIFSFAESAKCLSPVHPGISSIKVSLLLVENLRVLSMHLVWRPAFWSVLSCLTWTLSPNPQHPGDPPRPRRREARLLFLSFTVSSGFWRSTVCHMYPGAEGMFSFSSAVTGRGVTGKVSSQNWKVSSDFQCLP